VYFAISRTAWIQNEARVHFKSVRCSALIAHDVSKFLSLIYIYIYVVSLYIGNLVSSPTPPKPSSLATSLSAIAYYHKIAGLTDPTSDFLIRKLLQGLAKSNPSGDQRLPITLPFLQTLISSATQVTSSPYEASLLSAMYSIMFHAF